MQVNSSLRNLREKHRVLSVNACTYLYKITINVPVVYLLRDIMILMRATSIIRTIGRGRGAPPPTALLTNAIVHRGRNKFFGLFHGRQSSYFFLFLVQVEPVTQVVTELVTELVNSTADTLHQIQVHSRLRERKYLDKNPGSILLSFVLHPQPDSLVGLAL
jgi:hypothetical protein